MAIEWDDIMQQQAVVNNCQRQSWVTGSDADYLAANQKLAEMIAAWSRAHKRAVRLRIILSDDEPTEP